jgi:hypothetical protein
MKCVKILYLSPVKMRARLIITVLGYYSGTWPAQYMIGVRALAVGPGKSFSVCIGQGDFENHCNATNFELTV